MVIDLNGVTLGTVRLPILSAGIQLVRVRISAALWQEAATHDEARLLFRFPDAESPASLGLGTDYRLIGGGFRSIELQSAGSNVASAASAAEAPARPEPSGNPGLQSR